MQLQPPDLTKLTPEQKDNLILELWAIVQAQAAQIAVLVAENEALKKRIADLGARQNEPRKTPGNSSVPPSTGIKANKNQDSGKVGRSGRRHGSLGRKGGGRLLAHDPDETIIAKAKHCCHCAAALRGVDHKLHSRYDKIAIPSIKPVVTRVERYAGHCPCCHGITLAPVPEGMQEGAPFSLNILDSGAGSLSALYPCHQLQTAEPVVPASVCVVDQRRRFGCHVSKSQAAL